MSKYLLSWDMYGLEALIPLDPMLDKVEKVDKELLFKRLADPEGEHRNAAIGELNYTVNMLMMRARYNSQRHYEIYTIDTTESITEDWLREMFETNPQGTVELIRERGTKLFSDRINQDAQLIR